MTNRTVFRTLFAVSLTTAAPMLAACSGAATPASPSTSATNAQPAENASAPSPPVPAATLVATAFSVKVYPSDAAHFYYSYVPLLTLSEIGGRSSATISSIDFGVAFGESDAGCDSNYPIRIAPGGMWTLPDNYCAPSAYTSKLEQTAYVTIQFTDDQGVRGNLTATAPIPQ